VKGAVSSQKESTRFQNSALSSGKSTVNLKRRCDFDLSHLHEVNKLAGSRHGHGLDVGGDVAQDGQQAVEEGLQPVVSARDNLR
jgi:hypothetical protein